MERLASRGNWDRDLTANQCLMNANQKGEWLTNFGSTIGWGTCLARISEPLQGSAPYVLQPRVARSSQPWAGGRNPFGIASPAKQVPNGRRVRVRGFISVD